MRQLAAAALVLAFAGLIGTARAEDKAVRAQRRNDGTRLGSQALVTMLPCPST